MPDPKIVLPKGKAKSDEGKTGSQIHRNILAGRGNLDEYDDPVFAGERLWFQIGPFAHYFQLRRRERIVDGLGQR